MVRHRVIVIDDDPLFRSLITSVLRANYIVAVAADGSEGFYKALEHPPDIAVIDVQMSGWDGLKTLRGFRSHPVLSGIPVVMLTSDASRDTVLAALDGGADDYVIKTSFSREEFLEKLERLLNGEPPPALADEGEESHDELLHPEVCAVVEEGVAVAAADRGMKCSDPSGEFSATAAAVESRLQEIMDDWE